MLENNRVKIRALEPEDLDLLYKWENDTSIWKYSDTYIPFSNFTLKKFIESAHLDIYEAKQVRFIIESNNLEKNVALGMIDLFEYDPMHNRAGVGIMIGTSSMRKKGYASAALDLIIDYSKAILHLHQLFCNISEVNTESIQLFESRGFSINGTKKDWAFDGNKWTDELFLQLML